MKKNFTLILLGTAILISPVPNFAQNAYNSSSESSNTVQSTVSIDESNDPTNETSTSITNTEKSIQSSETINSASQSRGINHKKGVYAMQDSSRSSRIDIAKVFADNSNLPGKNFIDISSHNGYISVDEFKLIKSYGISGVAVKLSEGTYYQNEFASEQIQNAKAAGLKISTYHYSRYNSSQSAIAEANFFVNTALAIGLGTDTIMINDAEDPDLTANSSDAHGNSLTFNRQMRAQGFANDALYVGKWWITSGYVNTNDFGKDRVWVAQYPYTPDATMTWNNDHGAWQWSSRMHFPGLENYQNRAFDISMSFSNFFSFSSIPLENYYTVNPNKVLVKKEDFYYSDVNLNSRINNLPKDNIVDIESVEFSNSGYPRLKTPYGYISANKIYVQQVTNAINDYLFVNPKKVLVKKSDFIYEDINFTKKTGNTESNNILGVQSVEFSNTGIPRLKTAKGYISANKIYVAPTLNNIDNYLYAPSQKVLIRQGDFYYNDLDFTTKIKSTKKDSIVDILGVEYTTEGYPRLKTVDGYISANKVYVMNVPNHIRDYYFTPIQKVLIKQGDYYYTDASFTTRKENTIKDSIVDVQSIEFNEQGIPRLKTVTGYISANKIYVQQVPSHIKDYYYTTLEKVLVKQNDYFYTDVNFTARKESTIKDSVIDVQGIEFTEQGIPRLKTSKGYISANKIYVQQVAKNIEDYYYTSTTKIVVKKDDYFYTDLSFSTKKEQMINGTIINIVGIEYTEQGIPRLKTAKGYISANKVYIKRLN